MHVDIVNEIIHWFHRPLRPIRTNAQLIVSAHNVGLFSTIWRRKNSSSLKRARTAQPAVHAAQDVSGLRRDTRLYPKYRSGVLGGIPKIG